MMLLLRRGICRGKFHCGRAHRVVLRAGHIRERLFAAFWWQQICTAHCIVFVGQAGTPVIGGWWLYHTSFGRKRTAQFRTCLTGGDLIKDPMETGSCESDIPCVANFTSSWFPTRLDNRQRLCWQCKRGCVCRYLTQYCSSPEINAHLLLYSAIPLLDIFNLKRKDQAVDAGGKR